MIDHRRRYARRIPLVLLISGLLLALPGADAALAAPPTITSFDPTSGVIGATVEISGSGFGDSSDVTAVTFNGIAATFDVNSNVLITATVPAGATTGPIAVTDSAGSATSATNFTVTPSPVPTITSFDPTSGPVGASVAITGTGFIGATSVTLNGIAAVTVTVDSDTQITATVPVGATTGPIGVTTPGGTATSASNFTVTGPPTPTTHERSITLELRRHLVARGRVIVADGFDDCVSGVPVRIQRLRNGRWRTIDTDTTDADGSYREPIPDRVGRYRAIAVRLELNDGADVCARDRSPREAHHH
ncbi:MAG: IPT/TIG domain-containing protein [Actinobacteria bacterium]|nr:IPT/TIG domain-containing protein [Actinomycetota bacterium]